MVPSLIIKSSDDKHIKSLRIFAQQFPVMSQACMVTHKIKADKEQSQTCQDIDAKKMFLIGYHAVIFFP